MREIDFDSHSPMGKTPHLNNVRNVLAFSLQHNCEQGGLGKVMLLDSAVMESDCRTCNDRFWAEMIIQSLMIFFFYSSLSGVRCKALLLALCGILFVLMLSVLI